MIAGMLGGTAIGKKNYFFRKSGSVAEISLDNDKNMLEDSKLELIHKFIVISKTNFNSIRIYIISVKFHVFRTISKQ